MGKSSFYIGYQEEQPKEVKRFKKRILLLLAGIVVVVSTIFAISQSQFKNSTFELGNTTEITGILHLNPYPTLTVEFAENQTKEILLLGFGKFGAARDIDAITDSSRTSDGLRLKLKGTLIYYGGKTLFQLENNLEGTYEVLDLTDHKPPVADLGKTELVGEIVDPKCYFGVMKPGRGKIHRSCAVRCISGGIPPVFVAKNTQDEEFYYILTTEEDEPINQEVLSFIGQPCRVSGKLQMKGDWMYLKIDPKNIQLLGKSSNIY